MILELDINELIVNQISGHQWIISRLIVTNQSILKAYTNASPIKIDDVSKLVELNIIKQVDTKESYTCKDLVPTDEWIFKNKRSLWWQELLETYPKFTKRPDGTEACLVTDQVRSKAAYLKKVITLERHNAIILSLKHQVDRMQRCNKMMYFLTLPKWIASEGWIEDMELMKYDTGTTTGFGTNLV